MEEELRWETYEYPYQKKPRDWYWALTIITISIAVTVVILNNILFALFIVLAGFSLALYATRPPEKITVTISPKGISLGEKTIPLKNIVAFNIDTASQPPKLLLRRAETLSLLVDVFIENVSIEEVERILNGVVKKDEELSEPWFQSLMEYIGF